MKKIFKTIKPYLELSIVLPVIYLAGFVVDYTIIKTTFFILDPIPVRAEWNITIPRDKKLEAKEYILSKAKKANLDLKKVDCLIDNESDYQNTWNVNNNKTVDFGIWMINSIHIKSGSLTMECATDLKCSTAWALDKLKKDKWDMWFGYKYNCQNL